MGKYSVYDHLAKLNVGCGQDIRVDFLNVDTLPHSGSVMLDIDSGDLMELPHNHYEYIYCHGVINELRSDLVDIMNQFYALLKNGGLLEIGVISVIRQDGNINPYAFSVPRATRYLSPLWVEFFKEDGLYANYPIGFTGKFIELKNELSSLGVHRATLRAVK